MSIYKDFVGEYLAGISPDEPESVAKVREYAIANGIPTMTPLEGKFLRMIAEISGAKKILELGTGLGYSSFWMSKAIGVEEVTTIEFNPGYAKLAEEFFQNAGSANIKLLEGSTEDIIPQLNETYDLIFMDHYKDFYVPDLKASLPLLKKGGTFIAHNALEGGWGTGVADGDLKTEKLKDFHRQFLTHDKLDAVILPLGEGFAFGIKKSPSNL